MNRGETLLNVANGTVILANRFLSRATIVYILILLILFCLWVYRVMARLHVENLPQMQTTSDADMPEKVTRIDLEC